VTDPIRQLRLWQRFHLRITALYALSVFAVLTVTALWTWRTTVDARVAALRNRLLDAVAAASWSVDPTSRSDDLRKRFAALGALDPELRGMYVLRTTDQPGQLEFVADWSRRPNDEAAAGTRYDATEVPMMLRGLEGPVVEDALVHDEWGWTLSSYAPIHATDGTTVGLVGIDVGDDQIEQIRTGVLRRTLAMYGTAMLFVGAAAAIVARSVRDPLGRTIAATGAIARGELDTRLALDRSDEFGVLGRHFDDMARGLQDRELIRGTFGRYVSEEVAAQLLAQPEGPSLGGVELECTILFSDLRGYSTISERRSPGEIVALLNSYLAAMQQVIDAHQGTVIEFLGDAILAVFGAPVVRPGHAEAAVSCALGMREAIGALNAEWDRTGVSEAWKSAGIPELTHRMGIHTGRVLAGNLGSATRMKFTVIGDAVNVASRLEQLGKEHGTDLLISEQTLAALPPALRRRCTDRGSVEVKGRQQSVRVFSVSDLGRRPA
jgi:adenylate cyclase